MTWARNIAHSGSQNPNPQADVPSVPGLVKYSKAAADITLTKQSLTLRRSTGLVVVLAVQPLLTTVAFFIKVLMRSVPVGEDFGLISVLGAMRDQRLQLLEGAALTGKLSRRVPIRFEAMPASSGTGKAAQGIVISLDERGTPQPLRKGAVYG